MRRSRLIIFLLPLLLFAQEQWQNQLQLAVFYDKSNQPAQAQRYFAEAWRNSAYSEAVYAPYLEFANRAELWDLAVAITERMHTRAGRNFTFRNDYALALARAGQGARADSIWQAELRRPDAHSRNLSLMFNTMLMARRFNLAVEIVDAAVRRWPQQYQLFLQVGNIYESRLAWAKATEYYLKYLERQPQQYDYIQQRIVAMVNSDEQAKPVLAYLQGAYSDSRWRELRGVVMLKNGSYSSALAALESAYQSNDARQFSRYLNLAKDLNRDGQSTVALRLLRVLQAQSEQANQKGLIQIEIFAIALGQLQRTSPTDSLYALATEMDQARVGLPANLQVRLDKIRLSLYENYLRDYRAAIKIATEAGMVSKSGRTREHFLLARARLHFRLGEFSEMLAHAKGIRSQPAKGEIDYWRLLSELTEAEQADRLMRSYLTALPSDHRRYTDILDLMAIHRGIDQEDFLALLRLRISYDQDACLQASEMAANLALRSSTGRQGRRFCLRVLANCVSPTRGDLFITTAAQSRARFPDEEDAWLLWQIAGFDENDRQKLFDEILTRFPESYEASLVRQEVAPIEAPL